MPGLPIPITPETIRALATALSMAPEAIAEIRGFVERFVPDQGQRLDALAEIQRIVARARGDAVQTTVEAAPEVGRPAADASAASKSWLSGAQAPDRTDPAWWRPAMGRYLAYGMFYVVVGQPLLAWVVEIARVASNVNLPMPPSLTIPQIIAVLGGTGVLASLRTVEKTKGLA